MAFQIESTTYQAPFKIFLMSNEAYDLLASGQSIGNQTFDENALYLTTGTAVTGSYLSTEGGVMSGSLILKGDPVQNLEAVTKQYVDNKIIIATQGDYLSRAGGTMTGNITFASGSTGLIQNQNSTSNYTAIVKWFQGGVSENTYDPQIGHHNTGETNGAIILLPYSTANSPWSGADGLYIGSSTLKFNNKTVLNSDNYTSYTVTKTGTGATGTWGISISGNAATATSAASCTGNAATATSATKATQDGNGATISSTYLKLAGGTMTGVINKAGSSSSWINGRDKALVRLNSFSAYSAITSMKTTNGSWDMGVYTSDYMYFTYTPDTNYSSGTNNGYVQIKISPAGQLIVPSGTDYTTAKCRNIYANTSEMTASSTALTNGNIYLQYV